MNFLHNSAIVGALRASALAPPGSPPRRTSASQSCALTRVRISAIVDACFRLIVDGESVLPWRRWGSAQELV